MMYMLFRILLRTRQLHVIRWQMLEPFLDKIKKNVHFRWDRYTSTFKIYKFKKEVGIDKK